MPESADTPPIPRPAATVILIRDAGGSLETLLLRRNSQLAFHGGSWVFPGGRVDAEDYPAATPDDVEAAARWAAIREAREESGLTIEHSALTYFSHWTTPTGLPKRFSTWFYLAPAPAVDVEIDGGEIHDHRWMRPEDALVAQRAKDIELPAPTFISLRTLAPFTSVASAMAHFQSVEAQAPVFLPRNQPVDGGRLSLYQADAAYESGDPKTPGPRHRLWMLDSGWIYDSSD